MTVLFTSLVGSRLHKLHKSDSDYDYRQVEVSPLSDVLLNPGKSNKHQEFGIDLDEQSSSAQTNQRFVKGDTTTYELNHFLRLLRQGNPTILEMLIQPEVKVPEACLLLDLRDIVDHRSALKNARGLAYGMRNKSFYESGMRKGKTLYSGYIGMQIWLNFVTGVDILSSEQTELLIECRSGAENMAVEIVDKTLGTFINNDEFDDLITQTKEQNNWGEVVMKSLIQELYVEYGV